MRRKGAPAIPKVVKVISTMLPTLHLLHLRVKNYNFSHSSSPLGGLVGWSHAHSKLSWRPGPLVGIPLTSCQADQRSRYNSATSVVRGIMFFVTGGMKTNRKSHLRWQNIPNSRKQKQPTTQTNKEKRSPSETHNNIFKIIQPWHPMHDSLC